MIGEISYIHEYNWKLLNKKLLKIFNVIFVSSQTQYNSASVDNSRNAPDVPATVLRARGDLLASAT